MSVGNADLVREAVAAFNRRDIAAVPKLFAPDVEFRESPEWPEAGVYRGLEALAGYYRRLIERIDGFQGDVERVVERGNHVLAYLRAGGRDKETGKPVELCFIGIFTFRDRRCVKLEGFLDERAALEAWESSAAAAR